MKRLRTFAILATAWIIPMIGRAQVTITNPLGETDPRLIVARVIQGALSVSGTLALVMFIYGGILWMTDMGRGDFVKKGKQIMVWAVLGIIVIASAYVITTALFNALATGSISST